MPLLRDNYLLNETSENEYIFLYYMFSVMTTYLPDEIPTELTMTNHFSEESLQAAKLFRKQRNKLFLFLIVLQRIFCQCIEHPFNLSHVCF